MDVFVQQPKLQQAIAAAKLANWQEVERCLNAIAIDRQSLEDRLEMLDLAMQILAVEDFQSRWDISKLIAKLGNIALPPTIAICQNEDLEVEHRWFAARLLGSFSDTRAVFALVELLQQADTPPELIEIAATSLATIGVAAVPALTELLATPEKLMAIRALSQIRHSQTIAPLLTVVDDEEPAIRAIAIEALSSFHDDRLVPIWIAKLTDIAPEVRIQAAMALSLRSALNLEYELINLLSPLLWDVNLAVCVAATLALSRFQNTAAVRALGQRLQSAPISPQLRSKVILALGWIGSTEAVDYLISALKDSDSSMAVEIITSIGRIESSQIDISKILHRYIDSLDPASLSIDIKLATIEALGNLGDIISVEHIVRYLQDPSDRLKFHAIAALKKISTDLPPQILELSSQADLSPDLQSGIALCMTEWTEGGKL
jgi:HEAT repeat protein